MRKLGKENTSIIGRKVPTADQGEGSWIKRHWLSLTLLLLVALTLVIRIVFSYGISAGSNFALSGTGAAEHKHTIESILTGTFGFSDPSLNYPYGGTLIQPPLVDIVLAGFAWIVTLFGISVSTASAGVLAFSGPIAAAITVVFVYILGKEMFDRNIGLISALLFATLPLSIVMSVFSNGSGMSVVLLFFVIASIFVVRAMKAIERSERGIKAAFTKGVMKYTIPAGIMFAAIALSWNGFVMIVTLLVFMMVAHAVLSRLNNREFGASFGAYVTMILLTILVALPYYVAAGLFTYVFTGPLLLSAISIISVLVFYIARKRSKIQSFLFPIIILVAFFVVLYLALPALFNDVVSGNQIYETPLVASLLASQNISVSYMATFYGWATVWMPFVIITYMLYKFGKKNYSVSNLTIALWMTGLFILSWLGYENAVMAGSMYAIAAAAVLVKLYRYINMTEYFQTMRGGGWKASLKKFLRPEPFISLICILFLVIAPNAMLLADAGTSTNRDSEVSAGYLGGIGYTVDTDEYNSMNMIWDHYSGEEKDGAVVTWFQDSSTAVDRGNFTSVTSNFGQGASAASNIMLAEGSAGALAAMAVRMIMGEGIEKYQTNPNIDAAVLMGVVGIINDPAESKTTVLSNPNIYPGVSADISEENAIYLVAVEYITSKLTETEVYDFYNCIRDESDGAIAYVALNAGMIPLFYRDGSPFSTIAYLNNYGTDANGATTKYFTYGYNGASYTDSMYESFIWKSLFGINEESGITANMAMDLVFSDGTVKAQPGMGLSGFDVECWYVKYNPSNDATLSDDGWVFMDGYEAVAEQKNNGGLINYFSSVVMMKVTDPATITSQSGVITYSGTEPLKGAKVAVFEKDNNGMFVQSSTSFTDENGIYSVKIPTTGADYQIRVYTATNKTVGGTYIGVITSSNVNYDVAPSIISGSVYGYTEGVTAVGTYSGVIADALLSGGTYTFLAMPSDEYTITAKLGAHTIGTHKFTIYPGVNSGVDFELSGKLNVTVKDMYGAPPVSSVEVVLESKLNGAIIEATTNIDGIAEFTVMSMVNGVANSGEYIVYVKDTVSTSASVKVNGTAVTKTDITVYDNEPVTHLGDITVMAPGYSSSANGTVYLPKVGDSTFTLLYDTGNVELFKNGALLGDEISTVDFNVTLKSQSGQLIKGAVTFFGVGGSIDGLTMTCSTDENGAIHAKLPAGTYTAYAVGNDGSCSITSSVEVLDHGNVDLTTEDGRKLTVNLTFNSGTDGQKGIAFRQVDVEVDGKTIYGMTDSKGKAVITIPEGPANVKIAGQTTGDVTWAAIDENVVSGTTDVSKSSGAVTVKPTISVTKNTWLWKSSLLSTPTIELLAGNSGEVAPGTYFCVEEIAGVYTYSKVNVYAGHMALFAVPDIDVKSFSLVNVVTPTGATVTVKVDPANEDAVYYKVNLTGGNYLLESSKYQFKAVNGSQISYINYDGAALDHAAFDLKNKVTLKGYVGVNGNGIAEITIGTISLFTEVNNGLYEVDVPAVDDTAYIVVNVKAKPSGAVGEYDYSGTASVSITAASEGTVITKNMQVIGNGTLATVTDILTVDVTNVSSTVAGIFAFDLTATPASDATATKTYAIKAVGPWQLKAYTVTVVGATPTTITAVGGTFDPSMVGDGDTEMKVSLVDLNGATKASGVITDGYVVPDSSKNTVKMMIAGDDGAIPDTVTDYEYLYAITIRNDANYLMKAVLTVGGVNSGSYTISDENGRMIDPAGSFPLAGKADTTLYVKLMKSDGDIPTITVSAAITATSGTPDPSGNVGRLLDPKVMVLDSSLSIDGNNVYNEGSSPQTAFWGLLLLSVIMIVLVFWLGSKRGVFTRRK